MLAFPLRWKFLGACFDGATLGRMKLLATSVVRGSQQGESHGGVYLLDLERQQAELKLDWNDAGIDWSGRAETGACAASPSTATPCTSSPATNYSPSVRTSR